jgi:hypothetical protein
VGRGKINVVIRAVLFCKTAQKTIFILTRLGTRRPWYYLLPFRYLFVEVIQDLLRHSGPFDGHAIFYRVPAKDLFAKILWEEEK